MEEHVIPHCVLLYVNLVIINNFDKLRSGGSMSKNVHYIEAIDQSVLETFI